jgi:PAS domain-containing protein
MKTLSADNYRLIFEASPTLFLVLTPDLVIAAVSDSYLRATMTRRPDIVGKGLFEIFPDNPAASGAHNLRMSLHVVFSTRQPHQMAIQKYDIRQPLETGGAWEERHWSLLNIPVLNDQGELIYIIHRVEDVHQPGEDEPIAGEPGRKKRKAGGGAWPAHGGDQAC